MQTVGAGDRTADHVIRGRPALPPQPPYIPRVIPHLRFNFQTLEIKTYPPSNEKLNSYKLYRCSIDHRDRV